LEEMLKRNFGQRKLQAYIRFLIWCLVSVDLIAMHHYRACLTEDVNFVG
jgi:hypothetical protein